MNPRLIRMIIILMFLAMTGLIGIQIYWIKQTMEQREQQFSQGVFEAIGNSINSYGNIRRKQSFLKILEKEDYLRYINKQLDSLDRVAAEQLKEMERNGLRADSIIENEKNKLRPGQFIKQNQIPVDGHQEPHKFFPEFDSDSSEQFNKKIEKIDKMLDKKSDRVNQLFNNLLSGLMEDGGFAKSDSLLLDSLLYKELQDKGIDTRYEFGIYNVIQERFLYSKTQQKPRLLESSFRLPMASNENFLVVFFPNKREFILSNLIFLLVASAFLIIIIIFSFAYTVNIIYRQKKISEIKTDLINNITHELKTPISTISLACQAINDPDIIKSESIVKNYINMISEENSRLGLLVENVLQSAVFERGDYKLKIRKLDLNQKLERVSGSLSIQARNKGITIIKKLNAPDPVIEGDEVMITNLVFNLVDNAIKYSSTRDPFIEIVTAAGTPGMVRLEVADNGIGISKEDQRRIFEKLFRVPTGNVHNVKGFGLGLSYVKSIVERHRGTITVLSDLGEGSRFIVELPLKQDTGNA